MPQKDNNSSLDNIWTIPNALSLIRMLLVIPIVQQLRIDTPKSNFTAFIIFIVAFFTDFLDGFLARILKSVSKIGQLIDPLGDKILAITVSAVLYFSKRLPSYLFILILARDVIISIAAVLALNIKKRIVLPSIIGKVTTFVVGIVLALYILFHSLTGDNIGIRGVAILRNVIFYGTLLSSLLLIVSGISYAIYYYENFIIEKKNK